MIKIVSPGKLNLTFDIVGDLPDGYHQVETIMQTVDIYDELSISAQAAAKFSVELASIEFTGTKADVPINENNLVMKAAKLFQKNQSELKCRVTIYLRKSVPVAGGMGGGSGNAAATLVALNELSNTPLEPAQLANLGAQLGADVPFFFDGGTQLGTHRGDRLQKLDCPKELNYLIVAPTLFGLQTAEVYKAFDESREANKQQQKIETYDCAQQLKDGNVRAAAAKFANCFEWAVFQKRPELKFVFDRLSEKGGLCTRLTGSGPTLYVCTESAEHAKSIQQQLNREQAEQLNGWHQHTKLTLNSWISKSTNRGVKFVQEF